VARLIGWLIFLALLAGGYVFARDYVRRHPQDVPWTSLDLRDPIGVFTVTKLAELGDNPAQCRALLGAAGARDVPAPPRRASAECGYDDGMRLDSSSIGYAPPGVVTSCPIAAALHLLETRILQPAALRHFGTRVVTIEHAGSYSCRRIGGQKDTPYSEHARANAFDVTDFRLADGTRVSVLHDWKAGTAKSAFLHEVRDGACRLFATVISPDYNAAHRDHLHLDEASRGGFGLSFCR
jgi:hypothetical protein